MESELSSGGPERQPFDAKPLTAEEYHNLLVENPSLVLRVSDGTGDGTYRFWVEDGDLHWRCLNWFSSKPCEEFELEVVLEDGTTQLLVERGDR